MWHNKIRGSSEEGVGLQCGSTKTRFIKLKQVDSFCCKRSQYATYDSSLWTYISHSNLWPMKCSSGRLGASRLHNDSSKFRLLPSRSTAHTKESDSDTHASWQVLIILPSILRQNFVV